MEAVGQSPSVPAPWRLVVFILASTAGVLGAGFIVAPVGRWITSATGVDVSNHVTVWTLVGGMLIGHWWTFRMVDPRAWSFVGLHRDALRPRAVAGAALLGAAAIGVPVVVLLALGWLRVLPAEPGSSLGAALAMLLLLLPAALWEELLLRGYVFATLREVWGVWRTLLATSVVFGLLHLQNEGATVQSVVLVTLAGIFLGGVRVRTESLYAAWAAHFAWNFVLAAILHAAVSGIGFTTPDYRLVDTGPDWATGGIWGPEGGVMAGLGLVGAIFILFWRPRSRSEPEA